MATFYPFLFEMSEIQAHFRELTGVQLEGTYSESLKGKGQGILAYKKTKSTKKVEQFVEILTHIDVANNDLTIVSRDARVNFAATCLFQ